MPPPLTPTQTRSLAGTLAAAYGTLPGVEAVALVGSRAVGGADPGADVDLYVFARGEVALDARRRIARASGRALEIGKPFFGDEDAWIDRDTGVVVEAIFWACERMEDEIARVLERCEARVGYSTCFWHSVRIAQPLFDRGGWLADLKKEAAQPYPEKLRAAVIATNRPLLGGTHGSFRQQIEAALRRGDRVSVQHRTAAFLTSYFDCLFALNRTPHPGEKRMVAHAERLPHHPPDLRRAVNALLSAAPADVLDRADALTDGLDRLIGAHGPIQEHAPPSSVRRPSSQPHSP